MNTDKKQELRDCLHIRLKQQCQHFKKTGYKIPRNAPKYQELVEGYLDLLRRLNTRPTPLQEDKGVGELVGELKGYHKALAADCQKYRHTLSECYGKLYQFYRNGKEYGLKEPQIEDARIWAEMAKNTLIETEMDEALTSAPKKECNEEVVEQNKIMKLALQRIAKQDPLTGETKDGEVVGNAWEVVVARTALSAMQKFKPNNNQQES